MSAVSRSAQSVRMLLAHVPPKVVEGVERRVAPSLAVTGRIGIVARQERDPLAVSLRAVEGDAGQFIRLGDLARKGKKRLAQLVLVNHARSVGDANRRVNRSSQAIARAVAEAREPGCEASDTRSEDWAWCASSWD